MPAPYTRSWDESTPLGSAAANTIETIFQNLKVDLRERLADVIPEWDDDALDKFIIVDSGLAASRPSSNLSAGQAYLATDTSVLSFYDGAAWIDFNIAADLAAIVLVDTAANRPAAGDVDEGTLFWASDTNTMYIQEATAWVTVVEPGEEADEQGVSFSGTIALNGTSETVTVAIAGATIAPSEYYPVFARVRFREAGVPGDWSPFFYNSGPHPWFALAGSTLNFIPDTDRAAFSGIQIRQNFNGTIDSATLLDQFAVVITVQQVDAVSPTAQTLDFDGMAVFRRMAGLDLP